MPTTPLDKTVVIFATVTATAAVVAALTAYFYDPRNVTDLASSLLSSRCVPRQGSPRKKKSRLYKERKQPQQQQPTDETMPRTPAVGGAAPGTTKEGPTTSTLDTHRDTPLESDIGAIRSLLATTTLREFLAARHVGRPEGVPAPRDVLILTPSCTVGEALSKLAERSVISAPLLRDDRRDYLGFVSVHDIMGSLIAHMFPPGPCGYASSTEAPEWFLLDTSPESRKRILGMLMERGEGFCDRTIGSIRRGPRGGDGDWLLDGEDKDKDSTLLDVIQNHFLPQSRVSLSSREGTPMTYPPLNHRVAVYRYTNDGPTDDDNMRTDQDGEQQRREQKKKKKTEQGRGTSGEDDVSGDAARGGLVEVTDIISLSDITRFLMRWNHIEHCLTPCTVKDLGVGSRDEKSISFLSSLLLFMFPSFSLFFFS